MKNFAIFTILVLGMMLSEKASSKTISKESLQECREHIREAVCLVDPVDYNNPFATQYNRPCLNGGEKFASVFEYHFDNSSPMIQKMYCSLEKIWIENNLSTTAYATPIYDMSNNLVAAGIGIKREFIENPLTLSAWFSHKEEKSFGEESGLNLISYKTKKKMSAIHYAINHEFGHIFDYANKLNRYDEDCQLDINPKNCIPEKGSWGEISWKNAKIPHAEEDFLLRLKICFYHCQGEHLENESAPLIFASLIKTNFQSTYATVNPKEDWAEAFALYLAHKENGLNLSVEAGDKTFDLSAHFNSLKLKKKREFVERFIRSDYKYPSSR